MASSNRHWPSMFKSKPCNNQQWSQHHDNNTNTNNHSSSLLSNSCGRSSTTSPFSGGEERSPEPKPRWNPKPEQIRILEAIFNSGMVNPPRDEIRRIRAQLQEYGQVGDANVFYWFQNRKSRSKHKQRSLQAKTTTTAAAASAATVTASSSSSSSSDKNSPKGKTGSSSSNNSSNNNNNNNTNNSNNNILGGEHFGNSPTSVNQCNNYFHPLISPPNNNQNHQNFHEFVTHEPVFFPLQQSGASVLGNNFSQGLCFANNHHHDPMMNGGDHSIHIAPPSDQTVGGFSSLLLGDMFSGSVGGGGVGGGAGQLKRDEVMEKFKLQQELSFLVSTPNTTTCTLSTSSPVDSTPTSTAISSSLGQILDVGDQAGGMAWKSTVFINGMAIEVPSAPFNVKEEFGEDVILVHATSGHPVMTNEWGVTLHSLQHGASYFLVGGHVVASPLLDKLDSTPDLLASEFPYQI